jgi:hypothetical protein
VIPQNKFSAAGPSNPAWRLVALRMLGSMRATRLPQPAPPLITTSGAKKSDFALIPCRVVEGRYHNKRH